MYIHTYIMYLVWGYVGIRAPVQVSSSIRVQLPSSFDTGLSWGSWGKRGPWRHALRIASERSADKF